MVANMLRRSRAMSGAPTGHQQDYGADSGDGMADILTNAASTLCSTARQISGEAGAMGDAHARKRPRSRQHISYMDTSDDHSGSFETASPHTAAPSHVKRRGRPPRDYGEELGPAFAVYASENYVSTEQNLVDRTGGVPESGDSLRGEVLRSLWDTWWLSSQNVKDRYLNLSRQEMAENETHMLELLLDYPLPQDSSAVQPTNRSMSYGRHSLSPQPANPFDVFLKEQLPLLRSKVPDWSDAEISRRLTVNWNSMSPADRERYETSAMLPTSNLAQQSAYPVSAAPTTPVSNASMSRGYPSSTAQRSGSRGSGHSAPRRAYVLFCRQERPMLVHENPLWDLPTVNKELGRRWKELSSDKKDFYHKLESKESESRASASVNTSPQSGPSHSVRVNGAYQRPGGYFGGSSSIPLGSSSTKPASAFGSTVQQRSGGKAGTPGSGNPNKGPSKAYVFYSRLNRKGVTTDHPEWDLATINRELGRMWKSLPTEERQTWESRAIAAANGDMGSAMSTPKRYASPSVAIPAASALVGNISTMTPSPIPASLAVSGDHTNTSTPTTPASGADTPTTKNGTALSDQHGYDGEGEIEDVEMQDDETDGGGSWQRHGNFDNQPPNAISADITPNSSSTRSSTGQQAGGPSTIPHGSNVGDLTLAKKSSSGSNASVSATKPPPMAKPAAVVASSTNESSGLDATGSVRLDDPSNSALHSVEASKGS
ncbi:hypothetical protein IWW48_003123 [Coemansia sp. RSA 1200]|nr:hypothetical protein IWW48_003123 [Coemansia sp. RSA 1200]